MTQILYQLAITFAAGLIGGTLLGLLLYIEVLATRKR